MLTPHEVASNLSYLLTQGPPDAQLAQAADAGTALHAGSSSTPRPTG